VTSGPRTVTANGVDLCVQTFGSPASPAVLLIGGIAMSMDWWEDQFCERLASGPRFVIRYDLRDTGGSVASEPGAPSYDGMDLVADAVALLDALGVTRAHVVGVSMGGAIAQQLALDHADRVASLTLIATTAGGPGLPPPSEGLRSRFAAPPPEPDWSDRQAVVDYLVDDVRAYAGTLPFDEDAARALVSKAVDRTVDVEASTKNHALLEGGEPLRPRLGEIRAPTLVLHGTADPLFPPAHGEALAAAIPRARLVLLEGMGHEVPPRPLWDQVVAAVLDHTA
jgi:pimeloyl-ACP methyl ester carboxylesterase